MIITIATGNSHKLLEIQNINPYKNDIILRKIDAKFEPEENGNTFEENAIIKAKSASLIVKDYALADDTGLCVDYLDGAPGLYSARYAPTQEEKIKKILNELNAVPFEKRTARFICNMVLTDKNCNIIYKTSGKIEGYIAESVAGCGGFGYDPIFFVPKYNKTVAELPNGEKNKISHRANALIPMLNFIKDNLI
ncbi:RdgB/HAM1 family non-canonical purine NTP pyrophosphatase [bacterium]|nr:RdgB/HAM1 family non-canonical purine NTP pyrophosphatase [bacterium]